MDKAMDALLNLNPNWIGLNSLFYEGPCDVLIHIRDYTRPEITDEYPDADEPTNGNGNGNGGRKEQNL